MSKSNESRDNRANQLNPKHAAYHRSRGASPEEADERADEARVEPERTEGSSKQ